MKDSSPNRFAEETQQDVGMDKPTFFISAGFLGLFIVLAFVSRDLLSTLVDQGFAWSVKLLGAYWQVLLLVYF